MLALYHGTTSVCSQKVRLVLAETGLDWESHELNLGAGDQFDPAYMKLNPDAVVPTLVHDGKVLRESSLIAEYVDRLAGGRLMPSSVAPEFATRLWLLRCLAIHEAINTMSFSTAYRDMERSRSTPEAIEARLARMPNPQAAAKRRDLFEKGTASVFVRGALFVLNGVLGDMSAAFVRGPWLVAEGHGLADAALLAYIDRLERLGMAGLWHERHPGVAEWLAASRSRPSYRKAIADLIPEEAAAATRLAAEAHWPDIAALIETAGNPTRRRVDACVQETDIVVISAVVK